MPERLPMQDDIHKRITEAEAFAEEWIVIVSGGRGGRQFLAPHGRFTEFRGSAARFADEAVAERAHQIRTATHPRHGSPMYPWVKGVEVEREK